MSTYSIFLFNTQGFQRRVLHLVVEIRDLLSGAEAQSQSAGGKRIIRMTTQQQLETFEVDDREAWVNIFISSS
jgi:hypothetical protein